MSWSAKEDSIEFFSYSNRPTAIVYPLHTFKHRAPIMLTGGRVEGLLSLQCHLVFVYRKPCYYCFVCTIPPSSASSIFCALELLRVKRSVPREVIVSSSCGCLRQSNKQTAFCFRPLLLLSGAGSEMPCQTDRREVRSSRVEADLSFLAPDPIKSKLPRPCSGRQRNPRIWK